MSDLRAESNDDSKLVVIVSSSGSTTPSPPSSPPKSILKVTPPLAPQLDSASAPQKIERPRPSAIKILRAEAANLQRHKDTWVMAWKKLQAIYDYILANETLRDSDSLWTAEQDLSDMEAEILEADEITDPIALREIGLRRMQRFTDDLFVDRVYALNAKSLEMIEVTKKILEKAWTFFTRADDKEQLAKIIKILELRSILFLLGAFQNIAIGWRKFTSGSYAEARKCFAEAYRAVNQFPIKDAALSAKVTELYQMAETAAKAEAVAKEAAAKEAAGTQDSTAKKKAVRFQSEVQVAGNAAQAPSVMKQKH